MDQLRSVDYAFLNHDTVNSEASTHAMAWLRTALIGTSIIAGTLCAADWFEGARRTGFFLWQNAPVYIRVATALKMGTAVAHLGIATAGVLLLARNRIWAWSMRLSIAIITCTRLGEFAWNQWSLAPTGKAFPFDAIGWMDILLGHFTTTLMPYMLLLLMTLAPAANVLRNVSSHSGCHRQ